MFSSDKYNKLVYEIASSKNKNIKPENFGLDYQEFKAIIDEIEYDGLFEKGYWALEGFYIFTGLTFKGRSFIESNDGKQYSKIERVEMSNNTHISVGGNNTGNIIVGDNNSVTSEYNIKLQELINSLNQSSLHDKVTIIESLENNKNDKDIMKNTLLSLLSRGAEIGSIASAVGAVIGLL